MAVELDNLFERARLALGQTSSPAGVGRALTDPAALTPAERKPLSEKWGVGENSPFSFLYRLADSPIALIGLVLAAKFPLPTVRNLFKFANTGIDRRIGMLRTSVFGSFDDIYHALPAGKSDLPTTYKSLLREVEGFWTEHAVALGSAITKYEAASGQEFNKKLGTLLIARLKGWEGKITKPIQLGPAFDTLTKDARSTFNNVWSKVYGSVEQRALLQATQEARIGLRQFEELAKLPSRTRPELVRKVLAKQSAIKRQVLEQLNNAGFSTNLIRKQEHYFPEMVSRGYLSDIRDEAQFLMRGVPPSEAASGRLAYSAAGAVSSPHALLKRGKMLPDPKDLERIKEYLLDPTLPSRITSRLQSSSKVLPYSLDFNTVSSAYLHSNARAFGWTVKGHGRDILQAAEALESSAKPHNIIRAKMLRDTFVPVALGRQTYKQFIASAHWSDLKYGAIQQIESGPIGKLLPTELKGWFTERLKEDRGIFNLKNLNGKIASHLYLGALGANPVSAFYNLTQSVLTTVPTIGLRGTLEGMGNVLKKAPEYFKSRGSGLTHDQALLRSFPEFVKEGLAVTPLTEEALAGGSVGSILGNAWKQSALLGHKPTKVDRIKAGMMSLFQATEAFNRLSAFEGTLARGAREGLSVAETVPIARRVVEATQFLTGPENMPALLANAGPLTSQFLRFPMRYLGFLMGPAQELGSGAQNVLGRNLGTMGRALLASAVTYEGGKSLGLDLSGSLMPGALPYPYKDAPFYPFPFVPPALSLPAAALFGEEGSFKRQLPLLVPGGVAASRAATAFAPSVAPLVAKKYADYTQPAPDGRIAMRDPKGALIGYVTPTQLYAEALGLLPGGNTDIKKEQELQYYITKQAEQIRGYKRMYLEAAFDDNDIKKAVSIRGEFKQRYPGLDIQVKPQDIQAIRLRQNVPKLARVFEALPEAQRPMFAQMVQAALSSEAEQLIGIDPALLTQPKRLPEYYQTWMKPETSGIEQQLQQQFGSR